jgi:HlyD family secretion protein
MTARTTGLRAVLAAAAALALALALGGCSASDREVRGSGTVELNEVDIASLVGGRVSRVFVEEGDSVQAGDTLAILAHGEVTAGVTAQEAELLRADALARDQAQGPRAEEREAAKADLQAAEAALKLAETELERVQALFRGKLVPQADLDRAQAQRDEAAARRDAAAEKSKLAEAGYRREMVVAARRQAEAAQAGLSSARSKARELILTAPLSGVVLLKSVEQGEVVGAGIPLLTLGDPAKLWMRVYVAAPQVVKIRVGDSAEVRVMGSRRPFPGRVTEIATRAEFTPRAALTEEERANTVFAVKVALGATDGILKPGLPADARILPGR